MSEFRRYYWDSSVFCSFFCQEAKRYPVVLDLLNEAHAGRVEIVTSSFALVEVLKVKGAEKITEKLEESLQTFFEYPFIKIVNADRTVCELSRKYVWKHNMASKDAVHMATAEITSKAIDIHGLFSWDNDFVKRDGKIGANFPISHPFLNQPLLRLETSTDTGELIGSEESEESVEE